MRHFRIAVGVAMLLMGAPGPARAHAILVESSPSINAALPPGQATARLRYNSRIDAARSRLTLIGPGGASRIVPIIPGGPPDILEASVELRPGAWKLRWQVLAIDGHITRGEVPFTVTAAPAPP